MQVYKRSLHNIDTNKLPFMSICCPTFNRPQLLPELLWCYLRQDYPVDRREMIILDDAGQYYPFHDRNNNVRLVSTIHKFPTLGHKRNATADLANKKADFLVICDDDDLYYDNWLQSLALAKDADLAYPSLYHLWTPQGMPQYQHLYEFGFAHAATAIRREQFYIVGKYRQQNTWEDESLLDRFRSYPDRLRVVSTDKYKIHEIHWTEPVFYLRRHGSWKGTYNAAWDDINKIKIMDGARRHLTPLDASYYLDTAVKHTNPKIKCDIFTLKNSIVGAYRAAYNGYELPNIVLQPPEHIKVDTHEILTGHTPLLFDVIIHKTTGVSGFLNGSSRTVTCAHCRFSINNTTLGSLYGPMEYTAEATLSPGRYTIMVDTTHPNWRHAAIAFKK